MSVLRSKLARSRLRWATQGCMYDHARPWCRWIQKTVHAMISGSPGRQWSSNRSDNRGWDAVIPGNTFDLRYSVIKYASIHFETVSSPISTYRVSTCLFRLGNSWCRDDEVVVHNPANLRFCVLPLPCAKLMVMGTFVSSGHVFAITLRMITKLRLCVGVAGKST